MTINELINNFNTATNEVVIEADLAALDATVFESGKLYIAEDKNTVYRWDGVGQEAATNLISVGGGGGSVELSSSFTATEGQTTFTLTGGYNVGYTSIYLNGILLDSTDYTATNGSDVILALGATAGDILYVLAFGTFEIADHYTKAQTDAMYEPADGTILKASDIGTSVLAPNGDGSNLTGLQSPLVAGTDYLAPDGDGSQLTGLSNYTPPTDQGADKFLSGDGTYANVVIPSASSTASGVVTTDAQTFAGVKTFNGTVVYDDTAFTTNIDCSLGNSFSRTVTENFTQTFSNVPASGDACIIVTKLTNAGAFTITWPTSIKWANGTAPTFTASGTDTVVLYTIDGGTTWYGNANIGYA